MENTERLREIIKTLASGMTIAETASLYGLPETDVQTIADSNLENINEQRVWLKEVGWIE